MVKYICDVCKKEGTAKLQKRIFAMPGYDGVSLTVSSSKDICNKCDKKIRYFN